MKGTLSLALALFAGTPAGATCVLTDSQGAEVLSGAALRWLGLCPSPYAVVRPDAASTGPWMARSNQWTQDFINRSRPGEIDKVVYPACGSDRSDGVLYLVVAPPEKMPDHTCALQAGHRLLVPAYPSMSIGGQCEPQVKQADEELARHQEHFAVTVDGDPLPKDAFWRNESKECFAFESPLTGMSVQVGKGPDRPLTNGYADGYWTMLRFDEPGTYQLRITQPPHKKWQWDETFSMDRTYSIRVWR